MTSAVAVLGLGMVLWLMAVGVIWNRSPTARREFPGGQVRLFVGQGAASSGLVAILLGLPLGEVAVQAVQLAGWRALVVRTVVAGAVTVLLRYGVPYARDAARDWERWAREFRTREV